MLKNLPIGKRLGMAFGCLLGLMLGVVGSAYWGMQDTARLARLILDVESPLVEHSQRARANTLGMRRFEKDVFLNLDAPTKREEYLAKWHEEQDRLEDRLKELEKLTTGASEKEALALMKRDMATYENGFAQVTAGIKNGQIKSAEEANVAIEPFKDEIRRLETTAYEF